MENSKIGIIGGGNMGNALIGGLIRQGISAQSIFVADHGQATCERLQAQWGIHTSTHNADVAQQVEILILAIKPQQMRPVIEELAPFLHQKKQPPLLISIAAGIKTTQIHRWLQKEVPLVRAMPNTPALMGMGITGLYAPPGLKAEASKIAENLLKAVGETVWLPDEALMDVVTALSGSGPGYFFYFMESLIQGAVELGLPSDIAKKLTLHTALGSAQMALQTHEELASLRQKVTSPGGTTEQGINTLKNGKLADLITETLRAAATQGSVLSKRFD